MEDTWELPWIVADDDDDALLPGRDLIARFIGGIDTIGLLITRSQVDESIADVFFDGETRRADSVIVTLALAHPDLNKPRGTLYGDVDSGIILYMIGLQPVESAERRLWRYLFSTRFEYLLVDGEKIFIDNNPIYTEV